MFDAAFSCLRTCPSSLPQEVVTSEALCFWAALVEWVDGERGFLGNGAWNLRRVRSRTYEARCLGVNIHPGARYRHTHTHTRVCNLSRLVVLSFSHDQIKAQAVPTHTPVCLHLHLHYTTFSPKRSLKPYLQMIYSAVYFCQLLTNRSVPASRISQQTRCG